MNSFRIDVSESELRLLVAAMSYRPLMLQSVEASKLLARLKALQTPEPSDDVRDNIS